MANNCKQCFNTHYQPHCHPTTKSLWLCSSAYCGPPHPSRRIIVANQKPIRFRCKGIYASPITLQGGHIYARLGEFPTLWNRWCRLAPSHFVGIKRNLIQKRKLYKLLIRPTSPIFCSDSFNIHNWLLWNAQYLLKYDMISIGSYCSLLRYLTTSKLNY